MHVEFGVEQLPQGVRAAEICLSEQTNVTYFVLQPTYNVALFLPASSLFYKLVSYRLKMHFYILVQYLSLDYCYH